MQTKFELNTIRSFLVTAQTGNMATAAKQLSITQPAVSTAIHRLETHVGTALFNRTSRPLTLTAAGRLLKSRLEPILLDLEKLDHDLPQLLHAETPDIRLGLSDTASYCISPFIAPALLPKVRNLSIYQDSTPLIIDQLLKDTIDIAIATHFPQENPDVIGIPLFKERFLIVTPRSYHYPIHTLQDINQLQKTLPVMRFVEKTHDSVQIERILYRCHLNSERMLACDNNLSVLSCVAHGHAWTIMSPLSLWMAKDFLYGVRVHAIDALQACRTFSLLYRHEIYQPLSKSLSTLVQMALRDNIFPDLQKRYPELLKHITTTP